MRCRCCDKLKTKNDQGWYSKDKEWHCTECNRVVYKTIASYQWSTYYGPRRVADVLVSGEANRKHPKPTLKEPDFDLYKGDDDVN